MLTSKSISQLGRVVTGKTPPTSQRALFEGDYMFVTPSDLGYNHYYCRQTERTVSDQAKAMLSNQFIPAEAVMFTCIGATIGKCAIAPSACLTNQQINSVITGPDTDAKFLYYLLCHNANTVKGFGGGSATPIVSKSKFENIRFLVPPFDYQEAASDILSAYDDLIENNQRRMALLEESARLLYREWFVYFRFPGHEHVKIVDGIPEGWERCSVGDILELRYGKALTEDARVKGAFPVYGSSGIVGTHYAALVEGPAIVVGRKGNVGSVYWVPIDFWPIDTVYFTPHEQSDPWVYLALPSVGFQNTDGGVPGLNRDFAYSRKIVKPVDRIRRLFNEAIQVLLQQCTALSSYNQKLAQARDLLLPRLINGEIAV